MSLPYIEVRPNDDGAHIVLNGNQCGDMWMTIRGCCYRHTNRDYVLSTDDILLIAMIMKGIEAFVPQDDD